METTGLACKIDRAGRIDLPYILIKELDINLGQEYEICLLPDDSIILSKSNHTSFSGNRIKYEVIVDEYTEKLDSVDRHPEIFQILKKADAEKIILPLETIFKSMHKVKRLYNQNDKEELTPIKIQYKEYLSMYSIFQVNHFLYKNLIEAENPNEILLFLFNLYAMPDYKKCTELLKEKSLVFVYDTLYEVLMSYNEFYDIEDIESIAILNEQIQKELKKEDVLFVDEKWICTCGMKNSKPVVYCKNCGKGKNGLYESQNTYLIRLTNHMARLQKVLEKEFELDTIND